MTKTTYRSVRRMRRPFTGERYVEEVVGDIVVVAALHCWVVLLCGPAEIIRISSTPTYTMAKLAKLFTQQLAS